MASLTSMLTPQDLLYGILYTLEQCGLLLRDACTLHESGAYPSALGLAALAREELGKSSFLQEKRRESVAQGKNIPLEEIEKAWDNHELKQKYGQHSIVQRSPIDTRQGKLVQELLMNPPGTEASRRARKDLREAADRAGKRTPEQRTRQREGAFYVDFDKDSHRWKRPNALPKEEARTFIEHAVKDYQDEMIAFNEARIRDAELFQALQAWSDRPELPEPQWPRFDLPI